jgi:predicted small secreted protein
MGSQSSNPKRKSKPRMANNQHLRSNRLQRVPMALVSRGMKYVMLAIALLALNGCNTLIGLGRDTKEGFYWCNDKIQNMRQNSGGGGTDSGAPVY